MFSGIVEEVGTVVSLARGADGYALTVRCATVPEGTDVGDSIAVNGVCLTAVAVETDRFVANLQPVTLRLTNLGDLQAGSAVNLERSLAVGARIGGHYVQGHIDGGGRVVSLAPDGEAVVVRIAAPQEILRYVVPRGFIAVDGVSLTVAEAFAEGFSVSLVAHTQRHTTLARQRPGYRANLEVDVVAKYVEQLCGPAPPRETGWDLLRRTGYI